MTLISKLLVIAGKDNFELDSHISTAYIAHLCWKYGWMMVRGKFLALFNQGIDFSCFIGSHVKLIEKRYLKIGKKAKIHDGVKIDALSTNGVWVGNQVVLGHHTVIESTGGLAYIGKGMKIGDRTSFGNNCFFGAAGGIEIGEDVIAGQFIRFHSENHNYNDLSTLIKDQGVSHKGIKIGNNCWIGSGAVFLDGAEIGDGCVVAANAVVSKKFENNSVIGGVPAKLLKYRGVKKYD